MAKVQRLCDEIFHRRSRVTALVGFGDCQLHSSSRPSSSPCRTGTTVTTAILRDQLLFSNLAQGARRLGHRLLIINKGEVTLKDSGFQRSVQRSSIQSIERGLCVRPRSNQPIQ
ncbi:hypothetical protein PROFUN_07956 [Planoprotostelium fungivorum]|uniref:Uncharacterized protein n=1 Tax=Planoprotostelium fungivorum TaxID=1890364 RepID=A0A2P6NL88_9EUKA|nr:hypothetical protein PROFUN_07956 [Planoprotostelium fungivorum]